MNETHSSETTKTHDVLNQPPPLTNYNLYLSDATLTEAIRREGADWAGAQLSVLGQFLGTEEAQRWGMEANENEPGCIRTTASEIAAMKWSFIPPGTP